MLKILIVGYKGMLGTDLFTMCKDKYETVGYDSDELDITDLKIVKKVLNKEKPNFIVNCAAYTNVDGCEENVDLAYKVNGIGVRNLAIAASQLVEEPKIVHISTDYVFDGEGNENLREYDIVNPLSVYGKSKLMGEEMLKSFYDKYFILRTQWLYGKNGNNFVKTMLKLASERDSLMVVDDQLGCPTYTKDLCKAIMEVIETENYGIYHVSNSETVSWYGFAKTIFELANVEVEVKPCTTDEFPRPAHRPKYSAMDNQMLRINGFTELRNYKEALQEYLKEEGII